VTMLHKAQVNQGGAALDRTRTFVLMKTCRNTPVAPKRPSPMQSIQPGKNEPNTLIEGAPRQPLRNKGGQDSESGAAAVKPTRASGSRDRLK